MIRKRPTARSRRIGTLASSSILLVGSLALAKSPDPEKSQSVFYGYANTEPALWLHKPRESIVVDFCARGAPPSAGSLVTLVPASTSLSAVIVHVTRSKRRRHDRCTVVYVEPVRRTEWLHEEWSKGGAWAYPRLIVVDGEQPKAHSVKPETLAGTVLPSGTQLEDVRIAVDIDGDDRVDAIARYACANGRRDCEEFGCHEVWLREDKRWQRQDQICSDD